MKNEANKSVNPENEMPDSECTSGMCGITGKSPELKNDDTIENDIIGASNYERAEMDGSVGMFAEQTRASIRIMEEVENKDQEKK